MHSHALSLVEPALETVLAGHAAHVLPDAYVFSPQNSQPFSDGTEPATHVHCDASVAAAAESMLEPQSVHATLPIVALYVLEAQAVHPKLLPAYPASHSQAVSLVLPSCKVDLLSGHGVHSVVAIVFL